MQRKPFTLRSGRGWPLRLQVCSDLRGGAHPQDAVRHLGPDLVQALTAVPSGSGAGAGTLRTPTSSGRAAATPEHSGSVANKTKTELYSMYVEAQRAQRQSAAEQKKAEDAFNQVSNSISAHLREFVGAVHLRSVHASMAHLSCASRILYSLTNAST